MEVTRAQVLAFRVARSYLGARLPAQEAGSPTVRSRAGSVGVSVAAAMALGLRTTVASGPGAALAARVAAAGQDSLDALIAARTVVEVIGMRASPHLILTSDWAVLTAAALPAGDASLAAALDGLKRRGDPFARLTPTRALALATDAARESLAAEPLDRGALSAAMTRLLPAELSPFCPACKSDHVGETLFRLAGAAGGYVRRVGVRGRASYCRPEDWLGSGAVTPRADILAAAALEEARNELTRRFLRAHGPSDSRGLAAWLGVLPADGAARWASFPDLRYPVTYQGRELWILAVDADALEIDAQSGSGVRLLPPYDPLLLTPDRATLVPDRGEQKELWRILGNPGAILARGRVAGGWRAAASGKRLTLTLSTFAGWDRGELRAVRTEAARLAGARGMALADVVVEVA